MQLDFTWSAVARHRFGILELFRIPAKKIGKRSQTSALQISAAT